MSRQPRRTGLSPQRKRRRRLRRLLAICAAGIAAVVFGLGQLVLPAIAADLIKASLLRNAEGVRVSVSAFPAVMLLFGHADSVTIHVRSMHAGGHGSLVELLSRVANVDTLQATIAKMEVLGLSLSDVSLRKSGADAVASAAITRHAIETALPADIKLLGNQEGQRTLRLTVQATLFGHTLSPSAQLIASGDSLSIAPLIPIVGFVHISVFADPQLAFEEIGMETAGERYRFHIEGRFV